MSILAAEQYNSTMSETDLAHAILKAGGEPLYYRELIDQVMAIKPLPGKDIQHIMAGIHTELNLDRRFVHLGKGIWGLREWMPNKGFNSKETDREADEETDEDLDN
jgi:DNA-directed RNA polymerase subunit delta